MAAARVTELFRELIDETRRDFARVPYARRRPKNVALVFRIRDERLREQYVELLHPLHTSLELMAHAMQSVTSAVSASEPVTGARLSRDVCGMIDDGWSGLLPCKLLGRDDGAVLAYTARLTERVDAFVSSLYEVEEEQILSRGK